MHRFYVAPGEAGGDLLRLPERERRHAADVLRVSPGETVTVLDGAGREIICQVNEASRRDVTLAVRKTKVHPAPACRITLVQAVPKGKIIESIIQKATELGAAAVVPLLSERVATRVEDGDAAAHKAEKWTQIAVEAIKQCGQPWLPRVYPPVTLPSYLASAEAVDLALVGSLQGDGRHPRAHFEKYRATHGRAPASVRLWIGPEGDFTPGELDAIRRSGAQPITLGPLVLRSETAALYTLSVVNYEVTAA
ncbi:MAG TPA: RsmE family RNA methyltransferase [Verrucomicrobiae bacterium]|jgi:16S rRNA (uracil1498-N3)-methyltransferase|nr:RsmE family RNA methyltransferase [Verrucomicrobiae bacterium]